MGYACYYPCTLAQTHLYSMLYYPGTAQQNMATSNIIAHSQIMKTILRN